MQKDELVNRIFWICFGVISICFNLVFSKFPAFADWFYYRGVFQLLRIVYDYTLGWLPFPMFYLVLPLTIYLIYHLLGKAIQLFKSKSLGKATLDIAIGILAFAGFFYGMFYWLWGYNYQKPNFETTMELEVNKMSTAQLYNELYKVHEVLKGLRLELKTDADYLEEDLAKDLESKVRIAVEDFLTETDYPKNGRVRIRKLFPRGSLLRISTAGVYIPFAIEGHIDPGLHPLTWPATMAHEMAHGYGFTDEGTCNFIGYQVCINQSDAYMQYSGWLMYFRYLYSNARSSDRDRFKIFSDAISEEVFNDLLAIDEYANRYPDIMPKVRDAVYDTYLKSHGVKEGLRSYSRMILLVNAWNRKQGKSFELKEGDLLFQDSDCGEFCDAIKAVTEGVEGYDFSHIGLLMKNKSGQLEVMEAISDGVVLTPIDDFMNRSKDDLGQPKIVVGRLNGEAQTYIPQAIEFINSKLDAEYDDLFDLDNDKYYCSELIHLAFKHSAGKALFDTPPMTFKEPSTDETYDIWVDYFKEFDAQIPEGELGLNPGSMSRSSAVDIVNRYF